MPQRSYWATFSIAPTHGNNVLSVFGVFQCSAITLCLIGDGCYNFLTSFPFSFSIPNPPIYFSYLHRWNPFAIFIFSSEQSNTHAFLLSSYIAFIYCTASCSLA